ncbi:MAG: hypothetical protein ABIR37_04320 [Candidatus Saccharimonadales bacterium]
MDEKSQQSNETNTGTPPQITEQPVVTAPVSASVEEKNSSIKLVEKITVWVMVLSALAFALISVLAIWGVISNKDGNVVARSFGTVATIAFAALIVNVGANMLDRTKKSSY